jgi:serine-type D-Ala-D-Ala carboxypeptidase/endopeptidase (penicillin-binding protein 4)
MHLRYSRLQKLAVAGLFSLGLAPAAFSQSPPPAGVLESVASLQARLGEHVSQARFEASAWGVKVVSLDTDKTLFEHNARKLLKPASNAKLYSGALALDRLGPDFRIKTSLFSTEPPSSRGVLKGNLIVYGRGDPSLAARFHDGDYTQALEPLVEALLAAGVKRINGELVGDESFFRGPPYGSSWTWNDLQYYYGAAVSALTVEDNVIDLVIQPGERSDEPCRILPKPKSNYLQFDNRTRTLPAGGLRQIQIDRPVGENTVFISGSLPLKGAGWNSAVAVHHPAGFFINLFEATLLKRGIIIGRRPQTVNWRDPHRVPLEKLHELAAVESRPMSEIVTRMMKPSQNLYAQLLLLQVGAWAEQRQAEPEPARSGTTEASGLRELTRFLDEIGVPKGEVRLEEGSGLSRGALVTPNATIELLRAMHRHQRAEIFRNALPIAGMDGTLAGRMKGTAAAGNVRAKTGTLRYVYCLSGYVTSAAGENLAFSIMLNNHAASDERTSPRADVDAIAIMLANFKGRSNAE